jgi:predicted short-subunit dehydrogenase-like oxidoreductase (DUF2520 family)
MSIARPRKNNKPTVAIVGSGRLGTALAKALFDSHYKIEAVVARQIAHSRRAAALLGSPTLALSEKDLQRLPASRIILITTPDGEIPKTASKIAVLKAPPRGRTVLHTSGALAASEVLAPLAAAGFATGSLHPLVSISDPRTGSEKLRGAFYCLEGDATANRVARSLVKDLKGHSFHIDSNFKPLYHAAAVMASGHVTALIALATEMLVECGLDEKTARRVLMPLLESTVANLSESDPAQALTGTFARGDLDTVKRHVKALSSKRLSEALAAYRLLGRRSLELAQKRIDADMRKKILRELE